MPKESNLLAILVDRLASEWRLKVVLTCLLNVIFWAGYGLLSHFPLFPKHSLPFTWIDQIIPFRPEWSCIYMTEYFTGIVPWFSRTRAELKRYVIGLSLMIGVSFPLFLLFPVASPRSTLASDDVFYATILRFDGAYNAFPSLHAAFVAYTTALIWRLFGSRAPAWLMPCVLIWGMLVLYSTIATRQHYFVDLVAGGAIGVIADQVAWRKLSSRNKSDPLNPASLSRAGFNRNLS